MNSDIYMIDISKMKERSNWLGKIASDIYSNYYEPGVQINSVSSNGKEYDIYKGYDNNIVMIPKGSSKETVNQWIDASRGTYTPHAKQIDGKWYDSYAGKESVQYIPSENYNASSLVSSVNSNSNLKFKQVSELNGSAQYYLNGKNVVQGSILNLDGKEYFVQEINDDQITLISETPGLPRFNGEPVSYTAQEYANRYNDSTAQYSAVTSSEAKTESETDSAYQEQTKTPLTEEKVGENTPPQTITTEQVTDSGNEWTTRADQYQEVKTLNPDHDHGTGSKDVGNVGNQDKAIVDFNGPYTEDIAKFNNGDGTIHAGEGISHHHHQTMTDSYTYNGQQVSYLPGQVFDLAGDPTKLSSVEPFKNMYTSNKGNNILGDSFNPKDGQQWSKIEYMAAMASSGKYSMQDLSYTADALVESGKGSFSKYEGPYFANTQFASWADDPAIKGKNYEQISGALEQDVNELIDGWKNIHGILEDMSGEAKNAIEFYTAQCIQGKFEVAMGNINQRLKPACLAINMLLFNSDVSTISGAEGVTIPANQPPDLSGIPGVTKGTPLMTQLKEGEKVLDSMVGKGASGAAPADPNQKDLTKEIEKVQEKLDKKQSELKALGSRPGDNWVTNTDDSGNETRTNLNAEAQSTYDTKKAEIDKQIKAITEELEKLTKKLQELEEKINNLRDQLNALMEYSMILLDFVKKYDTFRGTFRGYVLPGAGGKNTDIYNWVTSKDMKTLIDNHDNIMHGFEDYATMPVISNKSDYKLGDVVLYDDAHGYIYAVTGEFNPLTGAMTIACFDKTGKQIGSDITVWDQREITPIKGIRDIPGIDEYDGVPDTFIIEETIPETTPKGRPTPTPTPTTTPSTKPVPHTKPIPETTPESTPIPETTPTPAETTPPEIVDTTPQPVVSTIPYDTIDYPGDPYNPSAPHTGLDSVYGAAGNSQSSVGLGALAGLAAGAAGLGLTGLINDKKEKKEEDEEKESSLSEVEDNNEKPKEDAVEQTETNTTNPSMPQMF